MGHLERLLCSAKLVPPSIFAGVLLAACTSKGSMNDVQLTDFATRYATAWSSQNPDSLAAFYADDGSLTVNNRTPSVGRAAVRATVQGFMNAFPEAHRGVSAHYGIHPDSHVHWTWTGTNTGPGGTGKAVHISGYEEWTLLRPA